MATFQKFNSFVDYLLKGQINLSSDTIKVLLTNTAPVPTNAKYSDVSGNELATGNGYTQGGGTTTGNALANNAGTESFTIGSYTFTSNTGGMGPFRYVVFYDATPSDKPLIGFFDYGQPVTLNGSANETFVLNPSGPLFTLG